MASSAGFQKQEAIKCYVSKLSFRCSTIWELKMNIKKVLLGAMCAATSIGASAAGTAKIECVGYTPTVTLTYSTGNDIGSPGLTYVGILSPDQKTVALLGLSNQWEAYPGGLYMPNGRHDTGLPAVKTIKMTMPQTNYSAAPQSTHAYVGYVLYAGHGALTPAGIQKVQSRRTALNKVKPTLVAKGTWNAQYESDDQIKQSLVQQNMTDNNKYGPVFTIPMLDCSPPTGN
jgi:hypothetical protein